MPLEIQALFVDPKGVYPGLLGSDNCWDEARDARTYVGSDPVVAHPPCARWCRLAESIFARTRKPEHQPGNDGGCFASALAAVRRGGGVLEHPANSKAWKTYGIPKPEGIGWLHVGTNAVGSVCEVWQSAYGHLAPKRTWLLYCGSRPPFELNWDRPAGTHAVSGDAVKRRRQGDAARPRLSGKQNIATPLAFAHTLIQLAEWSR
jgi:hypothetical protein